MVKLIDKLIGRQAGDDDGRGRNLVARSEGQRLAARPSRLVASRGRMAPDGRIPNASKIYGAAAAAFFVLAGYFVFIKGMLLTGFLVFALGGALLGYALFYMRFQN